MNILTRIIPFVNEEPVVFITGPERGFSKEEEELLETKAKGVRLNKNILRAETAPIAATAILCNL